MANNSSNVAIGKGVQGGYIYSAELGADLPTDYSTEIDETVYTCLGYISEDGIAETTEESATEVVDMRGDTVLVESGTHAKKFTFTEIETKAAVLAEFFGEDCVTDEGGVITVKEVSGARTERVYVFDLVLSGDRRERIVVPDGKVTEVTDITYASGSVVGYGQTVTAFPDDGGVKTIRYIASTETEAA